MSIYEEYRKLDEDQADDMQKVGFDIIPLDKVRENSYILVGSRYKTKVINSKYEFVSFSDVATLIRGVNYQKSDQSIYRTDNVVLTADNITLSGELAIAKEIFVNNKVVLSKDKQLKKMIFLFVCQAEAKNISVKLLILTKIQTIMLGALWV